MIKTLISFGIVFVLGIHCHARKNEDSYTNKEKLITFSGVVYDIEGAVISARVSISAMDKVNTIVQSRTTESGRFVLKLQPGIYQLVIEAKQVGFKKQIYTNFRIVDSTLGTFNSDFVLEAGGCDDCDWIRDGLEPIPVPLIPMPLTKPESIPLNNKPENF